MSRLVTHFDEFSDFLRPHVPTHIILVSDDEAHLPEELGGGEEGAGEWFLRALDDMDIGPPGAVQVHSIASERTQPEGRCAPSIFDPEPSQTPCACDGAAAAGDEFARVSEHTGGQFHSVCSSNWDPIFDGLAERVVDLSTLPCSFAIPQLDDDYETVDLTSVQVFYEQGDASTLIPEVANPEMCDPETGGWHYDDPSNPLAIELCAQSCGQDDGTLSVLFECAKPR